MGLNAVKHVRSLMSGIFQHAAALGYTSTNPIHFAKVLVTPRAPKATPHYTVLEMASALTVLQGQTQARLAMVLTSIGLRPSEIRGLKREDVNLDAVCSGSAAPLGAPASMKAERARTASAMSHSALLCSAS